MQKVLPGVGAPPPHSPPEDCTPCWPRPCPRWPPRSASPRGCPGPRGGSPPAAPARSPRGWGWSWRAGGGWTRCRRGAARGCGRGTWGQPLTTLTSAAHLTDQFARSSTIHFTNDLSHVYKVQTLLGRGGDGNWLDQVFRGSFLILSPSAMSAEARWRLAGVPVNTAVFTGSWPLDHERYCLVSDEH